MWVSGYKRVRVGKFVIVNKATVPYRSVDRLHLRRNHITREAPAQIVRISPCNFGVLKPAAESNRVPVRGDDVVPDMHGSNA